MRAHRSGGGEPNGNGHAAYLGACAKHLTERAVAQCEDCGGLWCTECLVPKTKKRQPTRCIDCALIAAGVRAPGPRRQGMQSMTRAQNRSRTGFL